MDLQRLQTAYQQALDQSAPVADFTRLVARIDWTTKPAVMIGQVIDMALALDEIGVARQLAQIGIDGYADDKRLNELWRILQPPRVIETNRPPKKGLSATMAWLQAHSHEYSGSWIAVREGTLVGTAPSRKALVAQLDQNIDPANVLITWIPE